jgi:hypothetical protein
MVVISSVKVEENTDTFNTKWRLKIRDPSQRFGRGSELKYEERERDVDSFLPPDAPPLLDSREGFGDYITDGELGKFGGTHQLDPTDSTGLKERSGYLYYLASSSAFSSGPIEFPISRMRIKQPRPFSLSTPPLPLFEPGSYVAQEVGTPSFHQQQLLAQQRQTAVTFQRALNRDAGQLARLASKLNQPKPPPEAVIDSDLPFSREHHHQLETQSEIEYYPGSNRPLGRNAAAMMRAEREGTPFRPQRPQRMVEAEWERLRMKYEEDRRKKHEKDAKAGEKDGERFWFMQEDRAAAKAPQPIVPPRNLRFESIDDKKKRLKSQEARRKLEAMKKEAQARPLTEDEIAIRDFIRADEGDFDYMAMIKQVNKVRHEKDSGGIGLGRKELSKRSIDLTVPDSSLATSTFDTSKTTTTQPSNTASSQLRRRSTPPASVAEEIPGNVHPISFLIRDADERWNRMVRKQSQTLHQAVDEYKRRYNRNPPAGFDKWFVSCFLSTVLSIKCKEFKQVEICDATSRNFSR